MYVIVHAKMHLYKVHEQLIAHTTVTIVIIVQVNSQLYI